MGYLTDRFCISAGGKDKLSANAFLFETEMLFPQDNYLEVVENG